MSSNISSAELRKRLEQLEGRLSATDERIRAARISSPHHQRELEGFRAKAGSLKQKLHATDETNWDKVEHTIGADWESLLQGFDRWAKRVDKETRDKS